MRDAPSSAEEHAARVEGFRLAVAQVSGYVAARAAADRQHVTDNLAAAVRILDDWRDDHELGETRTYAFLVGVLDLVQILAEQVGGPDGRQQVAAVNQAVATFAGRRTQAKPPA